MNIIVLLTIGSAILHYGDALQCYECNDLRNRTCGDPFDASNNKALNCTDKYVCMKTIQVLNGNETIVRGCIDGLQAPAAFADKPVASAEMYICEQDLCNVASSTTAVTTLTFVAFLFLVFSGR